MTGNLNFSFSFLQIFKVGMEEAIKNHITVSSSHFNMIESALKELGNEIRKVEQETESPNAGEKAETLLQRMEVLSRSLISANRIYNTINLHISCHVILLMSN